LSLLLSVQSGDRISVGKTVYTVLDTPLRLASATTAPAPLSEDDTPLSPEVTVSLAGIPSATGITLRFTAPAHITITRHRGSAAQ